MHLIMRAQLKWHTALSRCINVRKDHVRKCPPSTARWTLCTPRECSSRSLRQRGWSRGGSRTFCGTAELSQRESQGRRASSHGQQRLEKEWLAYPPLNAPTGFRSGSAAVDVSSSVLDDWKVLVVFVRSVEAVAGLERARNEGVRILEAITSGWDKSGSWVRQYRKSVFSVWLEVGISSRREEMGEYGVGEVQVTTFTSTTDSSQGLARGVFWS